MTCAAAGTSTCTRKIHGWAWRDSIGKYFRLRTRYEVCYRYNAGIVTVLARGDEVYDTRPPWVWRGRVDGYPNHYRYSKYVDFNFRNHVAFCLPTLCWPERITWLTIRFFDTNQHTYSSGTLN